MTKDDIHVYPLNDKKTHKLKGVDCECNPKIEVNGANLLIIHNSYDNREVMEQIHEENMSKM